MAGEQDIIAAMDAAEDAAPPEDRPVSDLDRTCAFLTRNDIGNAQRLLARYGNDLAYHPAFGWLVWDGKRWEGGLDTLVAQLKGQATVRAIYVEAKAFPAPDRAALIEEAAELEIYGGKDLDAFVKKRERAHTKLVDGHFAFARASGNQGKIVSMLDAAAPHRMRRPEEFDARPWIFNAANRALHLRPNGSHEDRPHHRGDLLTKLGGCVYDAKAKCPRFEAFLGRIQPKPQLRAYLQRLAGYLLTGDIGEQSLEIFQGGGGNGKGTLLNAWRAVLGEYGLTAKYETFGEGARKSGSDASPDIARWRGGRMIVTGDLPADFQLNEGVVKQATGEEPITARKLHKDDLEFEMSAKVIMPCNPPPRIRGTDEGIWRRVHMVPFAETITDEEKRAQAKEGKIGDLLKLEAAGILNWMLAGYAMWRREGLNPPDEVRIATSEFRQQSDPLGEFLDVWTDKVAGKRAKTSALFEAFKKFCEANSYPEPKSGVTLGKALKARGFESMKSEGVKVWLGLGLRDEPREDAKAIALDKAELAEMSRASRAAWEADLRARGEPIPDDPFAPEPPFVGGDGGGRNPPSGGDFDGGGDADPNDDTGDDYR
ncbi:hypothetical protein sos41_11740 [Alphaproteobacteria bacterium SO-S41]|nr:hypothetical protein sos41_11740 [Alphaproteobacteria bacterium SO-S41]